MPAFRSSQAWVMAMGFLLWACEKTDTRFASPAATFKTHQQALRAGNGALLWACYSRSYQQGIEDSMAWQEGWKDPLVVREQLSREIAEERVINDRIGYLLFDATTLADPRSSPFFYFLRDPDGWKITSHLDSTFHQQLEQAIEMGEYKLPDR